MKGRGLLVLAVILLAVKNIFVESRVPGNDNGMQAPTGCDFDNQMYANGQVIYEDPNKCYTVHCSEEGHVVFWEDECYPNPPPCDGQSIVVDGQCCPICNPN